MVHRRGASPAPVTTPKTAAAWRPAAGLCRARRCAGRTSAAASGRSAMKQSGPRVSLAGSPALLLRIAADPKHLGAKIGFLAVLHTWGQNLHHHPHLHCVVPGGGIAPDSSRWISCRQQFLFPVKVLSRLFRAKFAAYLKNAFQQGELGFHGKLEALGEGQQFITWLKRAAQSEWVVYAKPPFGGPQQVLR